MHKYFTDTLKGDAELILKYEIEIVEAYLKQLEHPKRVCKGPDKN